MDAIPTLVDMTKLDIAFIFLSFLHLLPAYVQKIILRSSKSNKFSLSLVMYLGMPMDGVW